MQTNSHESDLRALLTRSLHTDVSDIDLEVSLNDALGIDSLTGLEAMGHVEQHFGVYFSDDAIAQERTLANILSALDDVTERRAS